MTDLPDSYPYCSYKGKTYLKAVVIRHVNAALERGELLIPPVGVVFQPTTTDTLYVVGRRLPFEGRFLVEPLGGKGGSIHALASAVKRIVSVPDNCPPAPLWERVPELHIEPDEQD